MPDKLVQVLQSRKFWTLIAALVAVGTGYFTGAVSAEASLQLAVAALAAYSIATGIEDAGK
jgi:hypothetical protein